MKRQKNNLHLEEQLVPLSGNLTMFQNDPILNELLFSAPSVTSQETKIEPKTDAQAAPKKLIVKKNIILSDDKPHYEGHRARLKLRFINSPESLPEYELLELMLFKILPRRDVKPLAKALLKKFGGFSQVLAAPINLLKQIDGLGETAALELKIFEACAQKYAKSKVHKKDVLNSWSAVLEYCNASMAYVPVEQFRLLFLNKRNELIADEVQQSGTIDHTPVYPREVVKRALELSAVGLILVHNHPSGDASPSLADIRMTHTIIDIAKPLGIEILDHVIVGKNNHSSLKALGHI